MKMCWYREMCECVVVCMYENTCVYVILCVCVWEEIRDKDFFSPWLQFKTLLSGWVTHFKRENESFQVKKIFSAFDYVKQKIN